MKAYGAEFFGTFVLVLMGCGSAVLAADHIGYAGVAASFGLALLAMVYTVGPISGCHLNPAVTLGLVLGKKFKPERAIGYVLAQIAGGIVAAGVLLVIFKGTGHYDPVAAGFASNGYGDRSPGHYSMAAAFLTETVLTALLVLVILGSTDIAAPVGFAGIAIGFVLTLIHLVSIGDQHLGEPSPQHRASAVRWPRRPWPALALHRSHLLGGAIAAPIYALLRAVEPRFARRRRRCRPSRSSVSPALFHRQLIRPHPEADR